MIAAIIAALGTGGAGFITGMVGNVITSITGFFTQKQKNAHDLALGELRLKEIDAESKATVVEAQAQIQITQTETDGKIAISEAEAYKVTHQNEDKPLFQTSYLKSLMGGGKCSRFVGSIILFGFGCSDILRKLCRPLVTYYFVCASTWVTILCYKISTTLGAAFTPAVAEDLFKTSVYTLLYLTTSCIGWWFADRRVAKFTAKLLDKSSQSVDYGKIM